MCVISSTVKILSDYDGLGLEKTCPLPPGEVSASASSDYSFALTPLVVLYPWLMPSLNLYILSCMLPSFLSCVVLEAKLTVILGW